MVKTIDLVKIFLKEIYLSKRNKNNKRSYLFLIVLFVLFIYFIFFYTKGFIDNLNRLESNDLSLNKLILFPISNIILSSIFFSLYSGSKIKFNRKDIAVLGSLPIKRDKIIKAKFIVTYISSSLFNWLIYISFIISLIFTKNINFIIFIDLTLITLFSPMIPLMLVSIISILLDNKIKKISETKTFKVISKIFSLIFVSAFVIILSISSGLMETLNDEYINFYYKLLTYYPFGYLIRMSFEQNNLFYSLIFAIIFILIVSIFIIIYSKFSIKSLTHVVRIRRNKKDRKLIYKEGKIFNILLKKDLKSVLDGSQIFIQTFLFPFLILLSSFILPFVNINQSFKLTESIELDTYIFLPIIISIFGICLNNSISQSMNGEYNKAWIIRTLPIKEKYIFLSKILLNSLYSFIPSFSLILSIGIKNKIHFVVLLLDIGLTLFSSILINIIYLLIALKFPSYSNDKTIKTTKSSLLSRLLSSLFASIIIALFISTTLIYNDIISSLILINVSLIILCLIFYAVLMDRGIKNFRKKIQ